MTDFKFTAELRRFKPVLDDYGVSRDGRVCNFRTGKILKSTNSRGYRSIGLGAFGKKRTYLVHRLVALAYIGDCVTGMQVNHKDGNKANNCVGNLEYVNQSQNILHAKRMGLMPHATCRLLSDAQLKWVKEMCEIRREFRKKVLTHAQIAAKVGASRSLISSIERGLHWTKN